MVVGGLPVANWAIAACKGSEKSIIVIITIGVTIFAIFDELSMIFFVLVAASVTGDMLCIC